jgi:hypothetical protein
MAEIKEYLKAEQVAPKLGYSVEYLLKLCQAGKFPHIRLNKKKKLFDPDDIFEFIESRKIGSRRKVRKVFLRDREEVTDGSDSPTEE